MKAPIVTTGKALCPSCGGQVLFSVKGEMGPTGGCWVNGKWTVDETRVAISLEPYAAHCISCGLALTVGQEESDSVVHPAHYNRLPIEAIDVVKHFDFCTGSAIKYLWRAGHKPGAEKLTDLKKALWYVQYLIDCTEERS